MQSKCRIRVFKENRGRDKAYIEFELFRGCIAHITVRSEEGTELFASMVDVDDLQLQVAALLAQLRERSRMLDNE